MHKHSQQNYYNSRVQIHAETVKILCRFHRSDAIYCCGAESDSGQEALSVLSSRLHLEADRQQAVRWKSSVWISSPRKSCFLRACKAL